MGKRELFGLLNSSFWCLVMVEWLFQAVPWGCLRFVIVVFPDHTHSLFSLTYTLRFKNIKVLQNPVSEEHRHQEIFFLLFLNYNHPVYHKS